MSTFGSWHSALARSTLCRCPSLTAPNVSSAMSAPPVSSSISLTIRLSSAERNPIRPVYGYLPAAATSKQVISSGFTRSVKRAAIFLAISPRDSLTISRPSRYTVPPMRASCPAILFKIVDLPAPFGPIRVTISPGAAPIATSPISTFPP